MLRPYGICCIRYMYQSRKPLQIYVCIIFRVKMKRKIPLLLAVFIFGLFCLMLSGFIFLELWEYVNGKWHVSNIMNHNLQIRVNVQTMIQLFVLFPFLFFRILRKQIDENNFKKELVFNYTYILLFIFLQISYIFSYAPYGIFTFAILVYIVIFKFRKIKEKIFTIVD